MRNGAPRRYNQHEPHSTTKATIYLLSKESIVQAMSETEGEKTTATPRVPSTTIKDRGVWTETPINQLYVSCDDGIIKSHFYFFFYYNYF